MPAPDGPVGRVLFRDPANGKNFFCSGSALNTPKQRMVLTAGHCVHDEGGGGFMQNWIFEPGFQNVPSKAGIFTAITMFAWTAFTQDDDPHYDYGVVITHGNKGGKLVNQVGGNGLIVNPGRPFATYVGYSSDPTPSNLVRQEFCQGQLTRFSVFVSEQVFPCLLFAGASGAPWMINVNKGFGDVVSLTSKGLNPATGSDPVFGPYFDGDTASLVNFAEAASP
jgi:V8-like Glu-specific endopeptidase